MAIFPFPPRIAVDTHILGEASQVLGKESQALREESQDDSTADSTVNNVF
jgi:hypothetical protein